MSENNKDRICLFAGTTEGRRLAAILKDAVNLTVCVATEYGQIMLDGIDGITVRTGRMDGHEMEVFFRSGGFARIIDATHPFARIVSENIADAARNCGIPTMRILRDEDRHMENAVYVGSVAEAASFLKAHDGNVLVTTGAKELSSYSGLDMSRVWARVLPCTSSLEACEKIGLPVAHIIAAQGPFPYEMNLAQLKMVGAKFLVTKESGKSGGFEEKVRAARDSGAVCIIVGQPPQGEGCGLEEAVSILDGLYRLPTRKIYLIGAGPSSADMLTREAFHALEECDAVIGAASVTASLQTNKPVYDAFLPEDVLMVLNENPSIRTAAIVMRGDTGFYSGARKMVEIFGKENLTIIPGISSVVAFSARLGISWDDAALISLHGRRCNLIHTVCTNAKTIALTGGGQTVGEICSRLCEFGLGELKVTVGEKLTCPDERIVCSTASDLAGMTFDSLSVMLVENPESVRQARQGIADDEFIRGDVPMTKSEVRSVSVSALRLKSDSVVWDIGAGTGSVSVECALAAYEGSVYAVEKEPDAVELIRQNRIRFRTENLEVVQGLAPDVLDGLPTPTHAFIGGSSGNLKEIVEVLLRKNPDVRIVVNTVTLESQTEAFECARMFNFRTMESVSVNISRTRVVGRYHMQSAQNPVTVFVMQNGEING